MKLASLRAKHACDRRNEYITMEVDYMQARNTIVKLESSLKAAEAQMKEYMEMEKEREYMSSAMSEEFSCMEETLRKTWEERKALEDRIISLETSNAELSASLKVEKMLRAPRTSSNSATTLQGTGLMNLQVVILDAVSFTIT